jgi:hypothetical protein
MGVKRFSIICSTKGDFEIKKGIIGILIGLAALLVISVIGFLIWTATPSLPGAWALTALKSDSVVKVIDHGNFIFFEPIGKNPVAAFLFYPGGHVDFRAYSPILRCIAERGYLVVLVRVNLNLAFFDIEAGAPALKDFPRISVWLTGGHSPGGVASAFLPGIILRSRGLCFGHPTRRMTGLKIPASKCCPSMAPRMAAWTMARKSSNTRRMNRAIQNSLSFKAVIMDSLAITGLSPGIIQPPSRPKANGNRRRMPRSNSLHLLRLSASPGTKNEKTIYFVLMPVSGTGEIGVRKPASRVGHPESCG